MYSQIHVNLIYIPNRNHIFWKSWQAILWEKDVNKINDNCLPALQLPPVGRA